LRIGVDIGGTFTDVVVFDEAKGSVALAKALSTPAELAKGVQEALTKAAIPLNTASLLIHGTTVVVNAIVERQGAKTALVTTQGFRDVYEIGRINRPESFNLRFRKHRPLVPRHLTREVDERLLSSGEVHVPLDRAGIAEACRALDFPVVSGNVSLYNETKGEDGSSLAILPTPAIGGVGLLDDWEKTGIADRWRGQ